MRSWREVGGWPLAVASLSLSAGVLFGVQTVHVEETPGDDPPATTEQPRTPTITTDRFVARLAAQVARRLHREGIDLTEDEVVELLTDSGLPGVVVTAPPTSTTTTTGQPRPPVATTSTTTSTTTTTTTEPRRLDLNDLIDDRHLPSQSHADPTVP